ncbi:MAG TPA: hypothetical protein VGD60_11440 [Candidatus Acidoferrales bacterium]
MLTPEDHEEMRQNYERVNYSRKRACSVCRSVHELPKQTSQTKDFFCSNCSPDYFFFWNYLPWEGSDSASRENGVIVSSKIPATNHVSINPGFRERRWTTKREAQYLQRASLKLKRVRDAGIKMRWSERPDDLSHPEPKPAHETATLFCKHRWKQRGNIFYINCASRLDISTPFSAAVEFTCVRHASLSWGKSNAFKKARNPIINAPFMKDLFENFLTYEEATANHQHRLEKKLAHIADGIRARKTINAGVNPKYGLGSVRFAESSFDPQFKISPRVVEDFEDTEAIPYSEDNTKRLGETSSEDADVDGALFETDKQHSDDLIPVVATEPAVEAQELDEHDHETATVHSASLYLGQRYVIARRYVAKVGTHYRKKVVFEFDMTKFEPTAEDVIASWTKEFIPTPVSLTEFQKHRTMPAVVLNAGEFNFSEPERPDPPMPSDLAILLATQKSYRESGDEKSEKQKWATAVPVTKVFPDIGDTLNQTVVGSEPNRTAYSKVLQQNKMKYIDIEGPTALLTREGEIQKQIQRVLFENLTAAAAAKSAGLSTGAIEERISRLKKKVKTLKPLES